MLASLQIGIAFAAGDSEVAQHTDHYVQCGVSADSSMGKMAV
jgi:hypothetical protein